jgi:hypothetical protein
MTQSELSDYQDSGSIDHTDEETLRHLYHGEGLSINDIADRADVDYKTVYYWMDKHDIQRQDKTEALREEHSVSYANYSTIETGRAYWRSYNPDDSDDYVLVYRLLAVAECGFDAVADNHVHHNNGIPWDNRPENIEVLSEEEHGRLHGKQSPR